MARTSDIKGAHPPDLWDPVVRITHWGIAVVVLANAALTGEGDTWHVWIGWIGMALLVLRLIWGLVGPREARFSAFPPSPRAAIAHLRELVAGRPRSYASHNPAGALMVYALWATLGLSIATGLWMTNGATPMQIAEEKAAVAAGDWSVLVREGDDGDDDGERGKEGKVVKEIHEIASNLLLILAGLHVAGVMIESRAMRRNLVKPMIRGADR